MPNEFEDGFDAAGGGHDLPPEATVATLGADHVVRPVEVPDGWCLLEGGVLRTIRVCRPELGRPDGRPFEVREGGVRTTYPEVRVNGPSRFVHEPGACSASLATYAPLLVKRDA